MSEKGTAVKARLGGAVKRFRKNMVGSTTTRQVREYERFELRRTMHKAGIPA